MGKIGRVIELDLVRAGKLRQFVIVRDDERGDKSTAVTDEKNVVEIRDQLQAAIR